MICYCKTMIILRVALLFLLSGPFAQAWAVVFTVNSVADDSAAHDANPGDGICEDTDPSTTCTLRAAIEEANALPGFDRVYFSTSGIIRVDGDVGRLPAITDVLDIDGRTAPGYPGASLNLELAMPAIGIEGEELTGQSAIGLDFSAIGASDSAVRALSLTRFDSGFFGEAIRIRFATNVRVDSCYIGLNRSGEIEGNRTGLLVESAENRIGRSYFDIGGGLMVPEGFGNVISGNRAIGLQMRGDTSGTVIGGNRIGTSADGLAAIPNGRGILSAGSNASIGVFSATTSLGNIVAGNLGDGIRVDGSRNEIAANRIGVNLNDAPLANGGRGIHLLGVGNLVGGYPSEPRASNLIANNSPGVEIEGDENAVFGNQLGLMASSQGNRGAGIFVSGGLDNIIQRNTILRSEGSGIVVLGAATVMNRNVVGFSGSHGIWLRASNAIVTDNSIGSAADGTPLGNAASGMRIEDNVSLNFIFRNTIAFNADSGIELTATAGSENPIIQNSIHSNGGQGIDLAPSGPTPNDPGDPDTGPNKLQNYPEITSLTFNDSVAPAQLTIKWRIDSSIGNSLYSIEAEFYLADDGVSGEGKTFLGAQDAAEPALFKSLTVSLPSGTIGGYLVATATDDGGGGSTSEFSPAIAFGISDRIFASGFDAVE